MKFTETTDAMTADGFTPGTVVVALDGYQVGSDAQYTSIRSLSNSPEMHFIVWDGQGYKELVANLPGRRFGVGTQTYQP
jgi:hypothetical protein